MRDRSPVSPAVGLLALVCGSVLAAACSSRLELEGKPNVVLIVVDTLRADAVFGSYARTPNIDALAADGISFPQTFSHAPITLPSHTALFSSRPPFDTGVMNNRQKVSAELPMLAEWLGRFGYETAAVISLGTLYSYGGSKIDQGFGVYDMDFWNIAQAPNVVERLRPHLDEIDRKLPFFLFTHFCDPHEPYNAHGSTQKSVEISLDGQPLERVSTSDMSVFQRTFDFEAGIQEMRIQGDHAFRVRGVQCKQGKTRVEPEFLAGSMKKPTDLARFTFDIPAAGAYEVRIWLNDSLSPKECRDRYTLEVEYVDRYVGEVLDDLKARGLYEDSLIVFTSDHGEALGERGMIGHIESLYDEMLHVPLIIKLPGGDPRAARLQGEADRMVSLVDIVPTLLDLVGFPALPGQRGVSLLSGAPSLLVAQTHKPEASRNLICLRDDEFKMIYDHDSGSFEMYDLLADPNEKNNVFEARSSERPDWVSQLDTVASLAAQGGLAGGELDPEASARLKALGY